MLRSLGARLRPATASALLTLRLPPAYAHAALLHTSPALSEEAVTKNRRDWFTVISPERRALVHDDVVRKIVCIVMKDGRKTVAERVVHDALTLIKLKEADKSPNVDVTALVRQAIDNIKPTLETRPIRLSGTVHQVPRPVLPRRQFQLAVRWLVNAARARKMKMAKALAAEITDALKHEGGAIRKRIEMHKTAEANRANAHYRWG